MIEKVVFDTSTLVSAALKPGSKPHQALMDALNSCSICCCKQGLGELDSVLNRKYFEPYITKQQLDAFLGLIRDRAEIFPIEGKVDGSLDPRCRDPKDDFILVLASVARADAIVTSDHDLLVMDPWRDIAILTPVQFLSRFNEGE